MEDVADSREEDYGEQEQDIGESQEEDYEETTEEVIKGREEVYGDSDDYEYEEDEFEDQEGSEALVISKGLQRVLLVKMEHSLTKDEVNRYSRQLILDEIGPLGQDKLKQAKILVVGAGGLGSPALLYLAGAGIGTLGVVDGDTVKVSNLHRQVIHTSARQGVNKAESAKEALLGLNDSINVRIYPFNLTQQTAQDVISSYDVVIDATDNALAHYLVNDFCILLNKPLVSGGALKFEGQLSLYGVGPCYRCTCDSPSQMSVILNGSTAAAGVMNTVPGVIGILQASEAIKVGLGLPNLAQKLLIYDALAPEFRVVNLTAKRPDCAMCGDARQIDPLTYDYEAFIGPPARLVPENFPAEMEITVQEYLAVRSTQNVQATQHLLLDVRPSHHYQITQIPGSVNIPLTELGSRWSGSELPVFCVCKRGNASKHAVMLLKSKGTAGND
jgi:adenylyltransferase/sulfurtransferase